jgi:hypothetical protein
MPFSALQSDSYNERNFFIYLSNCVSGVHRFLTRILNNCTSCINTELESMSISFDEIYTFDHDPLQGVILGFWNMRGLEGRLINAWITDIFNPW